MYLFLQIVIRNNYNYTFITELMTKHLVKTHDSYLSHIYNIHII